MNVASPSVQLRLEFNQGGLPMSESQATQRQLLSTFDGVGGGESGLSQFLVGVD